MNIATHPTPIQRHALPFRDGVGMVLFNERGEIWLGARRPRWIAPGGEPVWQMPQGGLLGRELPLEAAIRELREETGATAFTAVAELDGWLSFELPDHLLGLALKGRYRGQRQLWYAFRFEGSDADFDLRRHDARQPEFEAWTWAAPQTAIDRIVPWKREVYVTVLAAFAETIGTAAPALAAAAQKPSLCDA